MNDRDRALPVRFEKSGHIATVTLDAPEKHNALSADISLGLQDALNRADADAELIDGGKPAAVLMSLEDFASYEETRYLLQSPRNADRLLQAVSDLERGEGQERRPEARSLP